MNLKGEILANLAIGTPPPKHMTRSPDYRPGMKFNADRFAELCAKRGYDPAEAALEILRLQSTELKPKEHLDAVLKLMEFAYPKQRAVEHSGNVEMSLPDLLEKADEYFRSPKNS